MSGATHQPFTRSKEGRLGSPSPPRETGHHPTGTVGAQVYAMGRERLRLEEELRFTESEMWARANTALLQLVSIRATEVMERLEAHRNATRPKPQRPQPPPAPAQAKPAPAPAAAASKGVPGASFRGFRGGEEQGAPAAPVDPAPPAAGTMAAKAEADEAPEGEHGAEAGPAEAAAEPPTEGATRVAEGGHMLSVTEASFAAQLEVSPEASRGDGAEPAGMAPRASHAAEAEAPLAAAAAPGGVVAGPGESHDGHREALGSAAGAAGEAAEQPAPGDAHNAHTELPSAPEAAAEVQGGQETAAHEPHEA